MAVRRLFLVCLWLACGQSGSKRADLRGDTLTISATGVTQGATATVTFVLYNDGATRSANVVVETSLVPPQGGAGTTISLGRRTLDGVDPSSNQEQSFSVAIPTSAPPGEYDLVVTLDPDNNIPETNEDNNRVTLDSPVRVVRRGQNVNLAASAMTLSSTTLAPEDSVTVSYTLRNTGSDGILASTKTFFYLSQDAAPSSDDRRIGEQTVGALGAGLSVQLSQAVTIPADMAQGSYFLLLVVNAENSLVETTTTDNVASTEVTVGPAQMSGVDLMVTALTVTPAVVPRGGTITVSFSLRNRGMEATSSFFNRIFLASSPTLNPASDYLLQNVNVSTLAAGESQTYERQITLPADRLPGTYYIAVFADPTNVVPESNEENNIRTDSNALIIQPPAMADVQSSDVSVSFVSGPADGGVSDGGVITPDGGMGGLIVAAGSTISVSFKQRNAGPDASGAYSAAIVLSANTTFEAADRVLKRVNVASLALNEERTITETVTLPTDTGNQPFYVGVMADPAGDQVVDSMRANNSAFWSGTLRMVGGGGCNDDMYEPNDTRDAGARLTPGTYTGLGLCSGEDWYTINVPQGNSIRARMDILGTPTPDIDLALYAPGSSSAVDSSAGSLATEEVEASFVTAGGDYSLRVYFRPGQYNLTVDVIAAGGAGIDLVPLNLSLPGATAAGPGDPFELQFTARNVGMTDSPGFEYRVSLVPATSACTTTVNIGTYTTTALTAGQSRTITQDMTLPMGTCVGEYFVKVELDPSNAVPETFNNNNNAQTNTRLETRSSALCPSDSLEPNNTRTSAPTIAPGTYMNLTVCDGADDYYAVYLGAGETLDVTINFTHANGDIDLSIQNETGNTLDSSTDITDMENVSYTATTAGKYFIRVYLLEFSSGSSNTYRMQFTGGAGIDLAVSGLSVVPSQQVAGEDVNVGFTVTQALPLQSLPTTAVVRFVQGANITLGTTVNVPALGPSAADGTQKIYDVRFPVPALAAGTYSVVVVVDPTNTQAEATETNNTATSAGFRVFQCSADSSEPNDAASEAFDVTPANTTTPTTLSNQSLCPNDTDWFKVVVATGQTRNLSASINFTNANGNLDLILYRRETNGSTTELTRSAGNTDTETVTRTGLTAGTYVLKVQGFGGAANPTYGLTVSLTQ